MLAWLLEMFASFLVLLVTGVICWYVAEKEEAPREKEKEKKEEEKRRILEERKMLKELLWVRGKEKRPELFLEELREKGALGTFFEVASSCFPEERGELEIAGMVCTMYCRAERLDKAEEVFKDVVERILSY
jgi:pentatricopeptide repeat protein